MQIRVLSLVINVGMMTAFLCSLIVLPPYRIGGGEKFGSENGVVATETTVSATITVGALSPTVVATGARFVETAQIGTSTKIATDVRRAETTPVPLLTGLAKNKPSMWGSKGFYVLLGLVYVTLLGLFIKQAIGISGGSHEQR